MDTQTGRDKWFQEDMQALLTGEKNAADTTLQHFVNRFRAAKKEFEDSSEKVRTTEQQVAEARTVQAKLTGYLEGLAIDLRKLWDERNPPEIPKAHN